MIVLWVKYKEYMVDKAMSHIPSIYLKKYRSGKIWLQNYDQA